MSVTAKKKAKAEPRKRAALPRPMGFVPSSPTPKAAKAPRRSASSAGPADAVSATTLETEAYPTEL